jgi:hypothetical protein
MKAKAILFGVPAFLLTASAALGEPAAPFLTVPPDAVSAAMAGARMALATGAEALFWNPAGLAATNRREAELSHAAWMADTALESVAVRFSLGRAAVGASATYMGMDAMEAVDATGYVSEGEVDGGDLAVGLGAAMPLPFLALQAGLAGRYVLRRFAGEDSNGFGVDAGVRRGDLLGGRLGVALCMRNLGVVGGFRDGWTWLPADVGLGLAWCARLRTLVPVRWNTGVDVRCYPGYPRIETVVGTELAIEPNGPVHAAVRAGYAYNGDAGETAGPTAGGGIAYRILAVDYAFASAGELGFAHTVSVSVKGF